jgi:hypothetical protein
MCSLTGVFNSWEEGKSAENTRPELSFRARQRETITQEAYSMYSAITSHMRLSVRRWLTR